jgi:hypothetical protein
MRLVRESTYWGAVPTALALLIGMTVLGCDQLSSTTSGSTASGKPITAGVPEGPPPTKSEISSTETSVVSTTGPTATTATTEALSSAEERLPNGHIKAMGFIDDVWVDNSGRHLRIDYAEMLTGAEADAAAVAAGAIPPGEHVPNDYWISNVNPMLREFDVSGSVAITTSTRLSPHDGFGVSCSWAEFISFWSGAPAAGGAHLYAQPWWIERDGNTIVKIDEQYLP